MTDDTSTIEVDAASRGRRQLWGALVVTVIALALLTVVTGTWWTGAAVTLTLVVQLALLPTNLGRAELRPDRLVLDHRWRRHELPWADVADLELRWFDGGRRLRSAMPRVELRDGRVVHSPVLSCLAAFDRRAEARAVTERLVALSAEHGFTRQVIEPRYPARRLREEQDRPEVR